MERTHTDHEGLILFDNDNLATPMNMERYLSKGRRKKALSILNLERPDIHRAVLLSCEYVTDLLLNPDRESVLLSILDTTLDHYMTGLVDKHKDDRDRFERFIAGYVAMLANKLCTVTVVADHDSTVRWLPAEGLTLLELLLKHRGRRFHVIHEQHRVEDVIEALLNHMRKCRPDWNDDNG